MLSNKLNWPGLSNIQVYFIDQTAKKIYDENSASLNKRDLNHLKNRYIKLSVLLKLLPPSLKSDAVTQLLKLSNSPGVQGLYVKSEEHTKSNVTSYQTVCYVPLTTLLAFVILFPWTSALQKLRSSVFEFLENFEEWPCADCGFIKRDCLCESENNVNLERHDFIGYASNLHDESCQTELLQKNTCQEEVELGQSAKPTSEDTSTSAISASLRVPPGVHFPVGSRIPLSVQGWPYMNQSIFGTLTSCHIPAQMSSVLPGMVPNAHSVQYSQSIGAMMSSSSFSSMPLMRSLIPTHSINAEYSFDRPVENLCNKSDITSNQVPTQTTEMERSIDIGNVNRHSKIKHRDVCTQTPQNLYDSKKKMLRRDPSRLKAPSIAIMEGIEEERLAKEKGESDSPKVVEGKGKKKLVDKESVSKSPPAKKSKTSKQALLSPFENNSEFSNQESLTVEENINYETLPPALCQFLLQPDVGNLPKPKVPKEGLWKFVRGSADLSDITKITETTASEMKVVDNTENVANISDEKHRSSNETEEIKCDEEKSIFNKSFTEIEKNYLPPKINELGEEHIDEQVKSDKIVLNSETNSAVSSLDKSELLRECGSSNMSLEHNIFNTTETNTAQPVSNENKVQYEQESIISSDGKINTDSEISRINYVGCFEYVTTGDLVLRCTFPGCEQCFDSKLAADFHNSIHQNQDELKCFQCPQCPLKIPFGRWFEFLRHLRLSHNYKLSPKDTCCWLCGLDFDTNDVVKKHEEYHYNSRYKCIHCGILFLTWSQLQTHLFTCVNKSKKEVNVGCPYCMFVFHIRNMRRIHISCHCDSGLTCPQCKDDVLWENWRSLRKHYLQKHGRAQNTMDRQRRAPPPSYRCQVCSIEVDSLELFYHHMRKVHDWIPYILLGCTQCSKTFQSKKAADWHERFAHSEEFSCSKCEFKAASKVMLKLHMQKHDERQLTCSECDKTFVHYHQLQIHMAKHARNAVHTCKICYQEFVRYSELRQHMSKEHAGIKERQESQQFMCESCTAGFPSLLALKQHVKKDHEDEIEDDEEEENRRNPEHVTPPQEQKEVLSVPSVPKRGRGRGRGKTRGHGDRARGHGFRGRRGFKRAMTWRKTVEDMQLLGQENDDMEEDSNKPVETEENYSDIHYVRGHKSGRPPRRLQRVKRTMYADYFNSPQANINSELHNEEDEEDEDEDDTFKRTEGRPDENLPLHLIDHNYFKMDVLISLQKTTSRVNHTAGFPAAGHIPDASDFEEYGDGMAVIDDSEENVFVPPSCRSNASRPRIHFSGGRGVMTRGGRRMRGPRILSSFSLRNNIVGTSHQDRGGNFRWSGMADILSSNQADDELTEHDLASAAAELQKDQGVCILQDLVMNSISENGPHQEDSDDLSLSPVKQLLQNVSMHTPLLCVSPLRSSVASSTSRTVTMNGGENFAEPSSQTEIDDIELKDIDYLLWHGAEDKSSGRSNAPGTSSGTKAEAKIDCKNLNVDELSSQKSNETANINLN